MPGDSPRVTLVCEDCGQTARRELAQVVACRGVHETPSEPAMCPNGHGLMVRKDGFVCTSNPEPKNGRFVKIVKNKKAPRLRRERFFRDIVWDSKTKAEAKRKLLHNGAEASKVDAIVAKFWPSYRSA